jgi:hypothetical protein
MRAEERQARRDPESSSWIGVAAALAAGLVR